MFQLRLSGITNGRDRKYNMQIGFTFHRVHTCILGSYMPHYPIGSYIKKLLKHPHYKDVLKERGCEGLSVVGSGPAILLRESSVSVAKELYRWFT